jgi:hypothetical protein
MITFKRIVCALMVGGSFYAHAQVAKYSNEFLAVGVGARALAMGNANIVTANDVTSGYYNPAGLLNIKSKFQVALMHGDYFAGIAKYDYGAISTRIDSNSVVSLSIIRFGVDNIPNTTQLIDANGAVDYSRISSFNYADVAALLSYSRKLKMIKGLNIGTTGKIIRRKFGPFGGAWGFGFDVGATYSYRGWNFAAVGRDITGTFNAYTYTLTDDVKQTFAATGNVIPNNSVEVTVPRLILGASRQFEVWKDKITLMPELNIITTFDGKRNTMIKSKVFSMDPVLGIELAYIKMIYLRGGIYNIQQVTDIKNKTTTAIDPCIGVGIHYKIFTLDYALTNNVTLGLYSNIFSVKIDIDKGMLPKQN